MSKVTLKIGDKFSNKAGIEEFITGFANGQIKTTKGSWGLPVWDFYYVNDVKYAKEDIIVPTGEFEPITKDNITEVLEYNGIHQNRYSLGTNCISYNWTSTNNVMVWSSTLCFDSPKWLEHLEVEFGKLKPLPKKANPFDVVKIGQWVRYVGENKCIGRANNKWYQRVLSTWELGAFWSIDDNGISVGSLDSEVWDLTDIRDYNPDEEIVWKVGDKYTTDSGYTHTIKRFDYIRRMVITNGLGYRYFDDFNQESGITPVNGRQGKYVIPPFDFVQTLLDNGFNKVGVFICNSASITTSTLALDVGFNIINGATIKINPTPENAKRIIDAANILKDLEV